MKVVIFAGGHGTRLSEETEFIPKPLVEIGGRPILWHIMKIYSYWGFNEFIILTGYKSHVIKDYFINYYTRYSDITIDMSENSLEIINQRTEPWKVTMLYTGQDTQTGSRLLRAENLLRNERFMLTYGDGVSDINIPQLLDFHDKSKKPLTVTAILPAGKFGSLEIEQDGSVISFLEKPEEDRTWINGGFFVVEPDVFKYLSKGNNTIFEREPLERLTAEGKLAAYKHTGFWKCMDTLRDKNELTNIWLNGKAPWALWMK
ncbi:MAG: glucose-1-phosphate cytidylyltransferase [Treponema sp.]|nr:glucose-1-phosphate cytidylyltransferase [Treponema sp.]